jgi:excisionase family DNA binding protein
MRRGMRSDFDARASVQQLYERTTVSVEQAAAVLGIGRSTAYAAARDGSLPVVRLSHRLLVPTARLLELIGCRQRPLDDAAGGESTAGGAQ